MPKSSLTTWKAQLISSSSGSKLGFLEGRNIIDNLLTFKLTQELVTKTKQEALLVKANFMKAYDRVEHSFIWAVIQAMGYHPHLIKLVKGLVENAKLKVHINGHFTELISLERGVRQGCPMSSLLFAISTQPFMWMLQEQVDLGELEGIRLRNGEQLTYQLFIDNTNIFLNTTFWRKLKLSRGMKPSLVLP